MEDSARFQINSPNAADEVIGGEVIIINFVNGNYYSLLDTGADIWQLLRSGATCGETTRTLLARYDGDPAQVQQGVAQFASDLEREGLIRPAPPTPENAGDTAPAPSLADTERRPFQPPQLNIYLDMKQMLLLDPIHEVDESGWPSTKPNPT